MIDDLIDALLLPEPGARQAWERWRAGIEIDSLPYACQQLFPSLSPAFPSWLEHDPAAGIFQGIVRRAWSQNQIRLRKAVELDAVLNHAGVRAAVAGPLAWSLRTTTPAIRAIPYLTFLVARQDVRKAGDRLVEAGWAPYSDLPSGEALDWSDRVSFHRDELQLNLHWRLLRTAPEDASDCEKALLARRSSIQWKRHVFETTSPEITLLNMLSGDLGGDSFPWQVDVALAGTAGIHWARFRRLSLRFAPVALERLEQLRQNSPLTIPALRRDCPALLWRKSRYFWREYRAASYHRKEALSGSGFIRFLAERWHLEHVWLVPFAGARRILEQFRSLAR